MRAKTEATIEDLYHVPKSGKAELVNGKIIFMSPTGFLPGYAAGEIFVSLRDYARRREAGYAIGDNVGFIVNLPNRRSFSPDAALFVEQPGKPSMKFIEGAPIFAAEVTNKGDYGQVADHEMADKRADYL